MARENEEIIAGIRQESAYNSKLGARSFDIYKENSALKDRIEILVAQVSELEKNNARLTEETQRLAKDRFRLSERLRSRSGSLERDGSNESVKMSRRTPNVNYLNNNGNNAMNVRIL